MRGTPGAGIYNTTSGGVTNLSYSTVAGNVSDTGAGYAEGGLAQAGSWRASTVAGNRTSGGTEQDCNIPSGDPASTSLGGNVVGDSTCGLTGSTDRQGAGAQGIG